MKCIMLGCSHVAPSEGARWSEADSEVARALGWFIWDRRAPVWCGGQEIQGMVICPEHRKTGRGRRLEALHNASLRGVANHSRGRHV